MPNVVARTVHEDALEAWAVDRWQKKVEKVLLAVLVVLVLQYEMLLDQMTFGNPLDMWKEVVRILLSITLHDAGECNNSTLYHTIVRFACRQALQGQPWGEEPANRTIAVIRGS